MRKSFLLLILIDFGITAGNAQSFELKGLEIYNPVYSNPAFTSSDRLIQADAIAYDFKIYNGYWLNAMSSLPNTNSSVGLSFGGGKNFRSYSSSGRDRSDENIILRSKNIGLSYAYNHSFDEDFHLSGGIRLTHSIINISDTMINLLSRQSGSFLAGVQLRYQKLYAGLSAGTGLYNWSKIENEANEIEVTRDRNPYISTNFIAGYSLGGERRVNFDPVVGFNFTKSFDRDYSNFGFYAGGNIIFVKTIGLGFTVGSVFSLSSSVTILDRVSLMLGVYQSELGDNLTSNDYSLGFDPLEFIVQLRIKL
jgi:hypothetical protein